MSRDLKYFPSFISFLDFFLCQRRIVSSAVVLLRTKQNDSWNSAEGKIQFKIIIMVCCLSVFWCCKSILKTQSCENIMEKQNYSFAHFAFRDSKFKYFWIWKSLNNPICETNTSCYLSENHSSVQFYVVNNRVGIIRKHGKHKHSHIFMQTFSWSVSCCSANCFSFTVSHCKHIMFCNTINILVFLGYNTGMILRQPTVSHKLRLLNDFQIKKKKHWKVPHRHT